ncbi:MAG TPA: MBL fold metallo-hydrolase [Nitrospirota bacterium]|nr:MBL fold metallo-hydrolase [Nitrospirota bacterium]
MALISLREAETLEVTILVDNYTDALLLESSKILRRPAVLPPNSLLAEHGFSCLIKAAAGSEEHTVLMDVGTSGTCFLHNADLLKIDLSKVEAVVISHGHFDHFWALQKVVGRLRKGIPLILHPEAILHRRLNIPALGVQREMPSLDEDSLKDASVELKKIREDSVLYSGLILVLGEVERETSFEKGFPGAEAKIDGRWATDPFHDDRGIVVKVKDKGLVIIGGCSHAGIINTVKHAQKVTRTQKVHAVLGGFHLTGPMFEVIIEPTIEEMKKIGPAFVIPMHCTGWKAITQFAEKMPSQFLMNSLGTTYVF